MYPFSAPWKIQKTSRFSDVSAGKKRCIGNKWVNFSGSDFWLYCFQDFFIKPFNDQCSYHRETSFYMMGTLIVKGLKHRYKINLWCWEPMLSYFYLHNNPLSVKYFTNPNRMWKKENVFAKCSIIEMFDKILNTPLYAKFDIPWTQNVNWTYLRRSEDVQDVFWTSYVRSIYVLCLEGWNSTAIFTANR